MTKHKEIKKALATTGGFKDTVAKKSAYRVGPLPRVRGAGTGEAPHARSSADVASSHSSLSGEAPR